jgi:NifU-like protein involved in Fe-S cluster formation
VAYSLKFKDHLAHPRNAGELPDANAVADETNPVCGDRIRLSLIVNNGRIETVKYLAYGCPPTLVCGSVLTELINGRSIEQVKNLTRSDLLNALGGLPSRKQHAAALAIETLHAALASLIDPPATAGGTDLIQV